MTPEHYGDWEAEYHALREGVAAVELAGRGTIAVSGEDRVRWLHGMTTNDVAGLAPGQGNYCFFLNAQGQIQADGYVLADVDRILIDCEPGVAAELIPWLEHYIIMDDAVLEDVSAGWETRVLMGRDVPWDRAHLARLRRERVPESVARAGWKALEALRIEWGIPRFGLDIPKGGLAHETGRLDAVHFNKGCYIGQEIVERVRSLGQVHRTLARISSDTTLAPGTPLLAGGREVGRVTSSAWSPGMRCGVALAIVRREAAETEVRAAGRVVQLAISSDSAQTR